VADAGWDPGRWICAVFWGKEYWVEESPKGQICAVLNVSELRLREDTRGHLSAILEAKGGWGIYALWAPTKKDKIYRTGSAKCTVQVRLGGTVAQFWGSREAAGLWNCVVQLPGRTVTAHFTVRGSKVTTLRVEIAQCTV